jgi:hypothetical protein
MGLTMVGKLLDKSGIDKHAFSLYSSSKYRETIAKLEIPCRVRTSRNAESLTLKVNEPARAPTSLRPDFHYSYRDFRYSPYSQFTSPLRQ